MNNEYQLQKGNLLDNNGNLNEAGYAFELVKIYNKENIKVSKLRIKEWDYYYFGDDNYGIALTIADNGYMGMGSVSILDFKNKRYINKGNIKWFTLGKLNLPTTSKSGNVYIGNDNYNISFVNENNIRHLKAHFNDINKRSLDIEVYLKETTPHSMVIATPFKKPKHFYYNQKINLLKLTGSFKFGNLTYKFNEKGLGVLDWGRGVWTYKNTWYWLSINSYMGDDLIGFNLGCGFGDTSKSSENMFFINDKAFKLEEVTFNIPLKNKKESYLDKWIIKSKKDDSLYLEFEPILDRHDFINAIFLSQDAHQVFGKFNGYLKLENRTYNFKDLLGFSEKVKNKW